MNKISKLIPNKKILKRILTFCNFHYNSIKEKTSKTKETGIKDFIDLIEAN